MPCADQGCCRQVVFGPALDGGYYLVGMSRFPGKIFEVMFRASSVLWIGPGCLSSVCCSGHAVFVIFEGLYSESRKYNGAHPVYCSRALIRLML